jgi:hypothetical protein
MEELALELERETLNSIGGRPVMRKKVGRPMVNLPRPIVQRVPTELEKSEAEMKRRQKSRLQATYKIERIMSLACPKRRRYTA